MNSQTQYSDLDLSRQRDSLLFSSLLIHYIHYIVLISSNLHSTSQGNNCSNLESNCSSQLTEANCNWKVHTFRWLQMNYVHLYSVLAKITIANNVLVVYFSSNKQQKCLSCKLITEKILIKHNARDVLFSFTIFFICSIVIRRVYV